jgi:hypothetical protein
MFEVASLPKLVVIPGQLKSAKVVLKDSTYTLLVHGRQFMTYNPKSNLQAKELYSSYDLAYGDVICSGLGFGLLPLWISQKVNSVKVYEKSQDVIDYFLLYNDKPDNMEIICADINDVEDECDCLLLDHYEFEPVEQKIENMKSIKIKHKLIWAWSMEKMLISKWNRTSEYLYGIGLMLNPIDFSTKYDEFKFMDTLPDLTADKVNEYAYTYLDKMGYTLGG